MKKFNYKENFNTKGMRKSPWHGQKDVNYIKYGLEIELENEKDGWVFVAENQEDLKLIEQLKHYTKEDEQLAREISKNIYEKNEENEWLGDGLTRQYYTSLFQERCDKQAESIVFKDKARLIKKAFDEAEEVKSIYAILTERIVGRDRDDIDEAGPFFVTKELADEYVKTLSDKEIKYEKVRVVNSESDKSIDGDDISK